MDQPSTKKELIQSERDIAATFTRIEKFQQERVDLKALFSKPKPGRFQHFSFEILAIAGINQKDDISSLPNEIIQMIFRHLPETDRVCFALTCKQYAAFAKHQKDLLAKAGTKRRLFTLSMRFTLLRRLKEWMPAHMRLCYSCLKYYLKGSGNWGGDVTVENQKRIAVGRAMSMGPRCPRCVKRESIERSKGREEYKRLEMLARGIY